jgi:phosphoenolpyruvate carboxykinase (ATP)
MVRAALDGALDDVPTRVDPNFGVAVPTSCPEVPASFLDPRGTWADTAAYDGAAARLSAMFRENFAAYADGLDESIAAAGPGGSPTEG